MEAVLYLPPIHLWVKAEARISFLKLNLKNKSLSYSSQGSQTGQLDFWNWLADGSTTG